MAFFFRKEKFFFKNSGKKFLMAFLFFLKKEIFERNFFGHRAPPPQIRSSRYVYACNFDTNQVKNVIFVRKAS